MAQAKPVIRLDIWSDLACPWCYVGKARLDKALAAFSDKADFDIEWHAYMIDPATKPEGEEYLAYNRRRWGGDGWTHDLRRSGAPDGAKFADWQWWPNTLKGHRLVALAKTHGKGHEANALLFRKSYEEGANISRAEALVEAGRELGLPEDVAEYLAGEGGLEEVRQDDAYGKRELGISGVPYFIVSCGDSKRYALSGAQPARAFAGAFEKALAEAGPR